MRKKRGAIITIAVLAGLALTLTLVVSVYATHGDKNIEVPNRYGFASTTLDDGTIIQYIGDLNTTYGSSGTGVFNSFVRIQGEEKKTTEERGYNTDGTLEFDTKSGKWTHSILLSEIPTIQVGGQFYWEFFADINESNSTPRVSLDDFELYLTNNPNLTGYPFGLTPIYDYTDANNGYFILINDVNQGSGRGDMRYLVPLPDGSLPANCNYGNPTCTTYLVLYSVWGGKGSIYKFDGGFEEWKVKQYPILQVSKDIEGSYDTPVSWDLDKEASATYKLFTGESVTHEYTVAVDPIFGDPENVVISGTITILGDKDDPVNATITDLFNGDPVTITGCSVAKNPDNTYTIAANATVTCTYEMDLDSPIDGTNVATATYTKDTVTLAFQGSADILVDDYVETLTGYPDITVNDDNLTGENWSASAAPASWIYTKTFTCDADEGSHKNTATINETGQSDDVTVTINCFDLAVTKTADEYYTRFYEWSITKSVTPETWNLFTGETGTSDYTVVLDKTGYHENEWQVKGEITITNNHPSRVAELTMVADIAGGITGFVTCPLVMDIPAGGTLKCTYDTGKQNSEDSNPFGGTNTATARQQLYNLDKDGNWNPGGTLDYQGTHAINFAEATVKLVDDKATVSDTYASGGVTGTFTDDNTFNYSRTFSCDGDEGPHANTASFTTINSTNHTPLTGSDGASVQVNCYDLSVTKTADEWFTRKYTWKIDKQVDKPGPIKVPPGSSVTLNYSVVVDLLSTTDNDWRVTGDIVVANSHPSRSATLTQVVDDAGGFSVAVVCPSLVVPAAGTLTCTYDSGVKNSPNVNPFADTNTATATQQLYTFSSGGSATLDGTTTYSGTHAIDFNEATMSEVDEQITVIDSYAGLLGTASVSDTLPKTFTYQRIVTADIAFCGSFNVNNTATFETNDTHTTGSDSVSVVIEVPCAGCTPGFWQGGAGSVLWDEVNDPQWVYGGVNPFVHDTLFNDFFNLQVDTRLEAWTMYDLVSTGGGSDPAQKAARDMVAAYLNESAFPGSFPATSLLDLETLWYNAVLGGDSALDAFHVLVSGWNSPAGGSCPLP